MYIHTYNDKWPAIYAAEADAITQATSTAIRLQHIGSTSVAGLCAKNCIDILGILAEEHTSPAKIAELVAALTALGFEYRGAYGIAGRHYFSKPKNPKCHLHVYVEGDSNIHRHVHFRDVMRENPELVRQFNDLKMAWQEQVSQDEYQRQKAAFYEMIETHPMSANKVPSADSSSTSQV